MVSRILVNIRDAVLCVTPTSLFQLHGGDTHASIRHEEHGMEPIPQRGRRLVVNGIRRWMNRITS